MRLKFEQNWSEKILVWLNTGTACAKNQPIRRITELTEYLLWIHTFLVFNMLKLKYWSIFVIQRVKIVDGESSRSQMKFEYEMQFWPWVVLPLRRTIFYRSIELLFIWRCDSFCRIFVRSPERWLHIIWRGLHLKGSRWGSRPKN